VVADRDLLEEARADVQALLHDASESDPILAPARDTAAERFPGVAEGWTGAG
jgi:hypothetical protein